MKFKLICFLTTLAALVFLGVRFYNVHLEDPLTLGRTMSTYYRSVPANDHWWLTSVPEQTAENRAFFEARRKKILELIERFRSVDELSEKMCKYATTMPLSVLRIGTNVTALTLAAGTGFNVVIIPQSEAEGFKKAFNLSTFFYFRGGDEGPLFFPAITMSDAFLACSFMHECGHGIRVTGKILGTQTEEEVLMHGLSLEILKRAVPEYGQKVAQILSRSDTKGFKRMLGKITSEDLREMDTMVHGKVYGREIARVSIKQHIFSVGFSFVDERKLPNIVKSEIYEWLDTVNRAWTDKSH